MNFDETPEIGSGSSGDGKSLFLKLKSGESIQGLFSGEPHVFYAVWDGKSYVETPKDQGGKFRFRINIVVNEDKKYVAKLFEQGAVVYSALKDLNADYPLEETLIKITRNGEGTDTTYSILPVPPKSQPTEAQLKTIKKTPVNALESTKPIPNLAPSFNSDEEIPF